jgi:hypothetical protein
MENFSIVNDKKLYFFQQMMVRCRLVKAVEKAFKCSLPSNWLPNVDKWIQAKAALEATSHTLAEHDTKYSVPSLHTWYN